MTTALANTAPVAVAASKGNPAGIVRRPPFNHADPHTITRKPGFNKRFDFGDIEALMRSIKANGILMPLRVKRIVGDNADGKLFELVDGDRRLTAIEGILAAGGDFPEGIPVIIVDKAQDDVTSILQMFEANTGKPFLPLEKAMVFKELRDAGLTIKEIESRTGCSDNDIVGCLALLEADDSVVAAVKSGSVSGGLAKSIAVNARGDKKKQAELVAEAAAAGKDKNKRRVVLKKVDEVRRAKAAAKGLRLKMRALSDHDLAVAGQHLADVLKGKLEKQGMAFDADLRAWAAADPELALAFTFGALEAMKAAAGLKISLDLS